MALTRARYIVDIDADRGAAPLSRRVAKHVVTTVLRLERVRDAMVSVTFVGNRRMAALNKRHIGHAGATDVISFGFEPATKRGPVVGDIYIAPDVAKANAKANGVRPREELVRLLVHGTLHMLGYDHPTAARERSPMWKRQEQLVRRMMSATSVQ